MASRAAHCCEQMTEHAEGRCPDHEDRADCPDALVRYSPELREYGIWIHDGGRSSIRIVFCPWCGAALPRSLRDDEAQTRDPGPA